MSLQIQQCFLSCNEYFPVPPGNIVAGTTWRARRFHGHSSDVKSTVALILYTVTTARYVRLVLTLSVYLNRFRYYAVTADLQTNMPA